LFEDFSRSVSHQLSAAEVEAIWSSASLMLKDFRFDQPDEHIAILFGRAEVLLVFANVVAGPKGDSQAGRYLWSLFGETSDQRLEDTGVRQDPSFQVGVFGFHFRFPSA